VQVLKANALEKVTGAGLVYLAAAPRLRHLALSNSCLSDAGLAALAGRRAAELTFLDLHSCNGVSGPSLRHLVAMTALAHLSLAAVDDDDANFYKAKTRAVTDDTLVHLVGLTALTSLCISFSSVTDAGLAHLAGLTGLECLSLCGSGVRMLDGATALTGMRHLSRLDLSYCSISDARMVHLASLTSLHHLALRTSRHADFDGSGFCALAPLTALESLAVSQNKGILASSLPLLAALTSLSMLDLEGCMRVSASPVAALSSLVNLGKLILPCGNEAQLTSYHVVE
jgi:Leucine Rich repeat